MERASAFYQQPRTAFKRLPQQRRAAILTPRQPRSMVRALQGGAVAQLGERVVRNDEVRGSIPLSSISA